MPDSLASTSSEMAKKTHKNQWMLFSIILHWIIRFLQIAGILIMTVHHSTFFKINDNTCSGNTTLETSCTIHDIDNFTWVGKINFFVRDSQRSFHIEAFGLCNSC